MPQWVDNARFLRSALRQDAKDHFRPEAEV